MQTRLPSVSARHRNRKPDGKRPPPRHDTQSKPPELFFFFPPCNIILVVFCFHFTDKKLLAEANKSQNLHKKSNKSLAALRNPFTWRRQQNSVAQWPLLCPCGHIWNGLAPPTFFGKSSGTHITQSESQDWVSFEKKQKKHDNNVNRRVTSSKQYFARWKERSHWSRWKLSVSGEPKSGWFHHRVFWPVEPRVT